MPKAKACTNYECGWPQGEFYRGPTVGAKCNYQNLELAGIGVDIVTKGSTISYVRFTDVLYLGNTKDDL